MKKNLVVFSRVVDVRDYMRELVKENETVVVNQVASLVDYENGDRTYCRYIGSKVDADKLRGMTFNKILRNERVMDWDDTLTRYVNNVLARARV
jgi:ribosomal protein S3AE